jgi:hypothetical protein
LKSCMLKSAKFDSSGPSKGNETFSIWVTLSNVNILHNKKEEEKHSWWWHISPAACTRYHMQSKKCFVDDNAS